MVSDFCDARRYHNTVSLAAVLLKNAAFYHKNSLFFRVGFCGHDVFGGMDVIMNYCILHHGVFSTVFADQNIIVEICLKLSSAARAS